MIMNRLGIILEEKEVPFLHSRAYKVATTSSGEVRLVTGVPGSDPEVLGKLVVSLPGPFLLLYVLHTPRGEGLPGRYQSEEMEIQEVAAFLAEYREFLMSDCRYDLWVRCIGSQSTLVWDRHDFIYGYGEIGSYVEALNRLGFSEGEVETVGTHVHHYRAENDLAAGVLLKSQNWVRTDLRPSDEQ